MYRDAESLLGLGAAGIAWGVLTADRVIDEQVCRTLVRLAGPRATVFHRAFDVTAQPFEAAQQLADLGVARLMTSGQSTTACAGAELIGQLRTRLTGRMEVIPAGGVQPQNVGRLLARTGCRQVHGSFRTFREDPAGPVAESHYGVTDRRQVAAVRLAIDQGPEGVE
jgi:copper homeostasis protein